MPSEAARRAGVQGSCHSPVPGHSSCTSIPSQGGMSPRTSPWQGCANALGPLHPTCSVMEWLVPPTHQSERQRPGKSQAAVWVPVTWRSELLMRTNWCVLPYLKRRNLGVDVTTLAEVKGVEADLRSTRGIAASQSQVFQPLHCKANIAACIDLHCKCTTISHLQTFLQICLTTKSIRRAKLLAHRFRFLCPWLWLTEPKKTAFYDAGTVKLLRLNYFSLSHSCECWRTPPASVQKHHWAKNSWRSQGCGERSGSTQQDGRRSLPAKMIHHSWPHQYAQLCTH